MAIDNPLDAAEALVRNEESRTSSALFDLIKTFLKTLPEPFAGFAESAFSYAGANPIENVRYLLEVYSHELKRLRVDFDALSVSHKRLVEAHQPGLIRDAVLKVRFLRDRKRIQRIGTILVAGVLDEESAKDPDITEDLMRMAMDLSDTDIAVLIALAAAQQRYAPFLEPVDMPGVANLSSDDIYSGLFKLQGFGLVKVSVADSKFGPGERFTTLKKGRDLLRQLGTLLR